MGVVTAGEIDVCFWEWIDKFTRLGLVAYSSTENIINSTLHTRLQST